MKKLLFACAAILLYQIIPFIGAPHLLWHWKMAAIVVLAAAIWLSQPALRREDVAVYSASDRRTVLLILLMAGVSTVAPELQWAYYMQEHHGSRLWNTVGLTMMSGGAAFRIWAIRTLGQHFTTVVKTGEDQTLVTHGPYRFLRHPSYLGALIAITGCAVLLQAWVGYAIANAALIFAYATRIQVEEAAMIGRFGVVYRSYQAHTYRLFPGIW